jgi:hypothetical protein
MRRDRARDRQYLTSLYFLSLRASQQHANVLTRSAFVQQLTEHLNTRTRRRHRLFYTNDLYFIAYRHNTSLNATRHYRAST